MALPHESECRARTRAPPRFGLTPETNGQGDSGSKVFGKSMDRPEGLANTASRRRRFAVPPFAESGPRGRQDLRTGNRRRAAVCAASIGGAAPARVGMDDGRGSLREGATRKTRSWDDPVEGGVAAGAIAAASIDSMVEAAGKARTAADGVAVRVVGPAVPVDMVGPVAPVDRAAPVATAVVGNNRRVISRTRSWSKACSSRRRTTRVSCAR